MLVNEMLNKIEEEHQNVVQHNYSKIHGIEQFHLFYKENEIACGITLPENSNVMMVNFYIPRINKDAFSIIKGSFHYGQNCKSVLYELPKEMDILKDQLEKHIYEKSDAFNEYNEDIKMCKELHETVKNIDNWNKQCDIINKRLAVENDFGDDVVEYDSLDFA